MPFCEEAARARNTTHGTMRAAVENEIQRLLPHGRARSEIVAKAQAVSSRTLTRRLAEEGTNFAEVVDGLRRSLAAQYLHESSFTLAQIGWLLGYEGSDLVPSCVQALDRPLAVPGPKRDAASRAGIESSSRRRIGRNWREKAETWPRRAGRTRLDRLSTPASRACLEVSVGGRRDNAAAQRRRHRLSPAQSNPSLAGLFFCVGRRRRARVRTVDAPLTPNGSGVPCARRDFRLLARWPRT